MPTGQLGGVHPNLCQQPAGAQGLPGAHDRGGALLPGRGVRHAAGAQAARLGPRGGARGTAPLSCPGGTLVWGPRQGHGAWGGSWE